MKHIVKFLALLVSICLLDRSSWDSDPTFLCLVGEKFILYYLCCSGWRPLVVFTFSKFWLNVSSCYFPVASIFHCVTWMLWPFDDWGWFASFLWVCHKKLSQLELCLREFFILICICLNFFYSMFNHPLQNFKP